MSLKMILVHDCSSAFTTMGIWWPRTQAPLDSESAVTVLYMAEGYGCGVLAQRTPLHRSPV